ncbi:hypothetical protein HMPREF9296_2496 [Prevotella disiens FB035-09AN]|uniref:Uncharacterized protein n=1 Tax=Prevotella disiens FB035-09AN TaxID=866771 RepID=E1KNW0_9BACT|nr:hypothetical protein [Prevotella disiens]EFL46935.1 hypothetical protein HMPREF9296_2496 [Prevotella disiens FB035-09AN]
MIDIVIRPDSISLVGSMKRIVISATKEVTFVLSLKESDVPIVQHTYTPNSKGRIEIRLEDILSPLLYFELKDVDTAYRQEHIAQVFEVSLKDSEAVRSFTFTAIRAGVDQLADSAENFLMTNFLTWQPTVKPVTYHTPEFLTYYAMVDAVVKCKIYYTTDLLGQELTRDKTIVLANLSKDAAWTIPVQYAIIAGKSKVTPSFYDVWIEDSAGDCITYVQRYFASDIKSEEEQWILFENSLGGIDTFRAYGNVELNAKHEHKIAEIEDNAEEYRVDTERMFKKNTGHLNKEERQWLLDFFPSLDKYIYINNHIRKIVVTDSDVNYEAKELPSNYNFTFKFADARPYLNLSRGDIPTEMLDVKVPDLGSFTIAPRLVEFQRLNLSGGALFPVQNPYADEWNVTTIAAIIDFIVEVLEKSYSANGGVGHTHTNYSLLQSLSLLNGYLLENGNKIKAGYADKARDLEEPVDDRFLSKLKADTAKELITFLKGITFGDSVQNIGFAKGLNGFGVWLDAKGRAHGQIDYLEVIGKAIFRSLQIDEYKHIGGNIVLSGANAIIEKVVPVTGGWKCYLHTDDGDKAITNDWLPGDQALCQTFNIRAGVYESVSNTYYWRCVSEVGQKTDTEEAYIVITDDDAYRDKSIENDEPKAGDNVVLCGHNTLWDIAHGVEPTLHRHRMNVTMITTSKEEGGTIEVYRNIHDFSLNKGNAIFHLSSDKIYMNSRNFEWVSSDGERIPNVLYRGDWTLGTVAAKYEAWYYSGGTWLSLVDGNTDEPTEQSPKWKKYAAKGEDGTSPYTVRVQSESGGNVIHNGQGEIVLVAAVFHGEQDITSTLQPYNFSWVIQTGNTDFDKAWNTRHAAVGNSITVRAEEVSLKAQIDCMVEIER